MAETILPNPNMPKLAGPHPGYPQLIELAKRLGVEPYEPGGSEPFIRVACGANGSGPWYAIEDLALALLKAMEAHRVADRQSATEPRYSFTQPICRHCYAARYPDREPSRLLDPGVEKCCDCMMTMRSGIYILVDPKTVDFPTMNPQPQGDAGKMSQITDVDDARFAAAKANAEASQNAADKGNAIDALQFAQASDHLRAVHLSPAEDNSGA